jgi:hypothetical protein
MSSPCPKCPIHPNHVIILPLNTTQSIIWIMYPKSIENDKKWNESIMHLNLPTFEFKHLILRYNLCSLDLFNKLMILYLLLTLQF